MDMAKDDLSFFSYARAWDTCNARLGSLSVEGELVCGSEDIANILKSNYVESYYKL